MKFNLPTGYQIHNLSISVGGKKVFETHDPEECWKINDALKNSGSFKVSFLQPAESYEQSFAE